MVVECAKPRATGVEMAGRTISRIGMRQRGTRTAMAVLAVDGRRIMAIAVTLAMAIRTMGRRVATGVVVFRIVLFSVAVYFTVASATRLPIRRGTVAAIEIATVVALLNCQIQVDQTGFACIIRRMHVVTYIAGRIFAAHVFVVTVVKGVVAHDCVSLRMAFPTKGIVTVALAPLIIIGGNILQFQQ